jgi:type IV secretory pathway TraG/TraD family ATPase VirD4
LEYASRLIGDEEVALPSVTRDPKGHRSTTSTRGPRRLLPPEDLRCLGHGEAILIYGTLPPARLRLRPWWETATSRRFRRAPRGSTPPVGARSGRRPRG